MKMHPEHCMHIIVWVGNHINHDVASPCLGRMYWDVGTTSRYANSVRFRFLFGFVPRFIRF